MYIVLPLAQETVKRPKRHHESLTNIRSYVISQIVEMRVTIQVPLRPPWQRCPLKYRTNSKIKMLNDECVTRELIDHLTLTHSNHNRIRYIILELKSFL